MKEYKYYYTVKDENGNVIFDHKSNNADRLLKLASKARYDDSGAEFCSWYFGTIDTNIPDDYEDDDEEDEQDYEEAFSWLKDLPDEENL